MVFTATMCVDIRSPARYKQAHLTGTNSSLRAMLRNRAHIIKLYAFHATFWALALLLTHAAFGAEGHTTARSATVQAQQSSAQPGQAPQYVGPGGCSASSCHGGVRPRDDSRIRQNEYSIWVVQDRHSKATQVLSNAVSVRMARILNLGRADTAPKCLACHGLDIPPTQRARSFEPNEGVTCENCHGAASQWLGPHTRGDWSHEKSVQLGMYDTKDLVKRTERCLSCHLGSKEKFVDHEMIAAGHPDLVFELDSFSAVMPRHWKEPYDKDSWLGVRTWGTGQAVQLRESLVRVANRPVWPEYAELDCFACHHDLTPPDKSWRQERGYPHRRAGNPPWNMARYAAFRQMAMVVDPEASKQLEADMTKLAALINELNPNRQEISALTARAAGVADSLARRMAASTYDPTMVVRLLRGISGDAENISGQGVRSAEQAFMALDSLLIAYTKNAQLGNVNELRAVLNGMYQQLENPATYQPARFAAEMRRFNGLLR